MLHLAPELELALELELELELELGKRLEQQYHVVGATPQRALLLRPQQQALNTSVDSASTGARPHALVCASAFTTTCQSQSLPRTSSRMPSSATG